MCIRFFCEVNTGLNGVGLGDFTVQKKERGMCEIIPAAQASNNKQQITKYKTHVNTHQAILEI